MSLDMLRPTQMTVGLFEVNHKRKKLEALAHHEQQNFLRESPVPAILGPSGHPYIVDHHHLGRAAAEAKLEGVFVEIISDLSACSPNKFWTEMAAKNWVHPYNEHGQRCSFEEIPHHLDNLKDDAYRSLASLVRHAGGYTKTTTPFAEFAWADYFRSRMPLVRKSAHISSFVDEAVRLAKLSEASSLPGYTGSTLQKIKVRK